MSAVTCRKNNISTHTLTWSVTNRLVYRVQLNCISTHTLTWSVTCEKFHKNFKYSYFNSHAHVERDTIRKGEKKKMQNFNSHAHVERDDLFSWSSSIREISTHTLTWSVTLRKKLNNYYRLNFNSHAHVERDTLTKQNFKKL